MRLTEHQIAFITEEIEQDEISFSHLKEDLIDHVCCDIEYQMGSMGMSFNEAYDDIRQQLGLKGFRQIQTNTLSLIDKNYRIMRNTMKVSGLSSLIMLGFGSLFKIMHWPGAGILLVLGFAILCFVFFPTALYVMNRESKLKGKQLVFLSAFVGGIGFMLGVLFKVMHWPGAGMLLFWGNIILLFVFIPLLVVKKIAATENKKEKQVYSIGAISFVIFLTGALFKMFHWPGSAILIMSGALALVSVFLPMYSYLKYSSSKSVEASYIYIIIAFIYFVMFESLLALNVSTSIINEYVVNEEQELKTQEQLDLLNASKYQQLNKTHALIPLKQATEGFTKQIEEVKIELVMYADKVTHEVAAERLKDIRRVENIKDQKATQYFMQSGKAKEFGEAYLAYLGLLQQSVKNQSSLSQHINKVISSEYLSEHKNFRSWEDLYFRHSMLIGTLNRLTTLQRNIRIAELAVLNSQIANQVDTSYTTFVSE